MKKLKLFLFAALILIHYQCQKGVTPLFFQIDGPVNENFYLVTVLGKGIDCGDTYLIQFEERLAEVEKYTETNSEIYYADRLPDEFKINDLHLLIKFRNPTMDELYPCSTLGPTYPHIIVIETKHP